MSTPWLTRNSRALAIVALVAVSAVVIVAVMRARSTPPHEPSSSPHASMQSSASATAPARYADAASCATCHADIARTYAETAMARGFSKVRPDVLATVDTQSIFHKPSNRHYTLIAREGRLFQRRHQAGFEGRETNILELDADYVIGSGSHARTFVHRTASDRLVQLPLSWYANEGRGGQGQGARGQGQGFWQMSPGYDRPAHLDFRRVIDTGCMSCHNGYPRTPVEDDREGPRFADLPEGIDCQRCHGPGQQHIDAIGRNDVDAARRAIVNPASLNRERQLETCLQCHLESTSGLLPFQIRRYERAPFSFVPGQPLGDYVIHFDHAPGTGRNDKFEINSAGYRLRQSACFQNSEMTCVTCHDPHDARRGVEAAKRYVTICKSCHSEAHSTEPASPKRSEGGCIDCHMPKRRAEDAVHVVMTDHYIQRERPARNLLAARTGAQTSASAYRGEVVPYYPAVLPASPENELYLAVAQVQDGSNLSAGIERLQQAIERHRPARPEFYYDLARAYAKTANHDAAIRWSSEALVRDPAFVPALKELGGAAMATGRLGEAAEALEKATLGHPRDSNALADLGNVYLQQGRVEAARSALERALALDPDTPRANNTMGLTLLRQGDPDAAGRHFRSAIRAQPDLAEAHNNLGNVLASRRAYDEAGFHFAQAIDSDPNSVEAHHSYGLVLALTKAYPRAVAELETAIRLAPNLFAAHLDLAEVLVTVGRRAEARAHFEAAARSTDPDVRAAALAALQSR